MLKRDLSNCKAKLHASCKTLIMTFEQVCKELGLENTPDWGIINSSGTRTDEFIEFISLHSNLDFGIQYEFVELVLASMNGALVEENYNWQLMLKFFRYIKPMLWDEKYYPSLDYWIRIKNEGDYPIGFLLESLKEIFPKPIA